MRFYDYNNRRINYIFDSDMYIMETFDQRIFNAWCRGMRFQLRQDLSDRVVNAIKEHRETGNPEPYLELFDYATKETPFWDILHKYLDHYEDVEKTSLGYVIHGEFLIDNKGNAWVRKEEANMEEDGLYRDWNSLCIVMQGHAEMADKAWLPDGEGKMSRVNALTMTIITKVMFLINPNMQDSAFTNQLPRGLYFRLNEKRDGGERKK